MRFPAFALGGLLLAAALPGLAQTVPAEPATELLPTAGRGYRLLRFGLNLDVTTNRNLSRPDTYRSFTGSTALGLRYRFGQ